LAEAGADYDLEFSVTVSDGYFTATQAIAISVTDANGVPTVISSQNIVGFSLENTNHQTP
jgi:VCBS repeat-containing protein